MTWPEKAKRVRTSPRVRASTLAAKQQVRQQGFRPTGAVKPVPLVRRPHRLGDVDVNDALSRLGRLPECVIDDPQIGNLCYHPF